jgi:hypothetical protein
MSPKIQSTSSGHGGCEISLGIVSVVIEVSKEAYHRQPNQHNEETRREPSLHAKS